MKIAIKILRVILIAILSAAIGIPAISYVMLSTDWAQARLRNAGERALTELLGTETHIESFDFSPFNRLKLKNVSAKDDFGKTALTVGEIEARFELSDLIFSQKFIVDYVVIEQLNLNLYKTDSIAPLNIAGIIQRLKGEEKEKEEKSFNLKLNSLEINHSSLSYDVLTAPLTDHKFNPQHISLSDINVLLYAPKISNNHYQISLKELSFMEQSGFQLNDLEIDAQLSDKELTIEKIAAVLPKTTIDIGEIQIPYEDKSELSKVLKEIPISVDIEEGSFFNLTDFAAFVPALQKIDYDFQLQGNIEGIIEDLSVDALSISIGNDLDFDISTRLLNLPNINEIEAENLSLDLRTRPSFAKDLLSDLQIKLPEAVGNLLSTSSDLQLSLTGNGSSKSGDFQIDAETGIGTVNSTFDYSINNKNIDFDIQADASEVNLASLLKNEQLGNVTGELDVNGQIVGKRIKNAEANFNVAEATFKGYTYTDITGNALFTDTLATAKVEINDPNISLDFDGEAKWLRADWVKASINGKINAVRLDELKLLDKYKDYTLSADISGDYLGNLKDLLKGNVKINNISFKDTDDNGLSLRRFKLSADNTTDFNTVSVRSDIFNGDIEGKINFSTLKGFMLALTNSVFPNLVNIHDAKMEDFEGNDLAFDFTISNAKEASNFFGLPVTIIDPVNISGEINSTKEYANIVIDAPWLLQGNKLIDNTLLMAEINGATKLANLYATTHMPTKKGDMDMVATINGKDGDLYANIDWMLEREIPINGNISMSLGFERDFYDELVTQLKFNPGKINFGEDVWDILPSTITYANNIVDVKNFTMQTPKQSIRIDGKASQDPADKLVVSLNKVQLLDIFETLEIDKALLCGETSGEVIGSHFFTKTPQIFSRNLIVNGIGYNRCVLGDGVINVDFDNETESFLFNAKIKNPYGEISDIEGSITPATESLDFNFDATRVRAGFMKPFMSAFCSDIDGLVTGKAHLYGTFKYIDLTGDVEADSLRLKLDFTNTWYYASPKIHIDPGRINLDNITMKDAYGHTALLNGFVSHDFFKDPVFQFSITDAKDFLCYDVKEADNPRWFGTIYGNGSVLVNGKPGVVNIAANMSTAPGSTFTFQLLDSEDAIEYSFISFRDATPVEVRDSLIEVVKISESERIIRQNALQQEESDPTAYNIDLNVAINNNAQCTIVMDPVGGDRIRAYGTGQMQLAYHSRNDDLWLYGTYELDRGDYNFTLQDIIIKEFKIREGSSITFTGDPYAGKLNIEAIYSTNANLSDLDESFLQDKDLNRTNVQVYAVLKVTGEMFQPDISFDLDFPTLNQDVYRKVRSIVSTDEMMNRQIIYLLALNRFYTPEYMASTTKGSELFSVASSTISSQLSSMLGKLSDNWSIAPNLRSDRGDFSDVEVDLNLSSSLLNNRLLFNGNFGYRDKSLNTNQFIGDFDIEYLLNRSGTVRLKAYNRYNDQNYYLRTAQTTQGVGIMFRRDFDKLFNFFKKKDKMPEDSINHNGD